MGKKRFKWSFYRDSSNKWRWRKQSTAKGEIVGTSSQGFCSRNVAVKNAKQMGYRP